MTATNTNANVIEITPLSGATLDGYKLGWLVATAKAAPDDTITITNASVVHSAFLQAADTGADESNTKSANIITLTKAVTTADVQGLIIYK